MKYKTLKHLSFCQKSKKAGRNSAGRITMFHRGGGSQRLIRRIDFKRNVLTAGIVQRIDYDPNRSAKIALVKWSASHNDHSHNGIDSSSSTLIANNSNNVSSTSTFMKPYYDSRVHFVDASPHMLKPSIDKVADSLGSQTSNKMFSYILGCDQYKVGDTVTNLHSAQDNRVQQVGTCTLLAYIPIGTYIHNIETRPGAGGKLVRSAGTFGQLVQKFDNGKQCVVRLPSGTQTQLNTECRATVGIVSNVSHNTQQLTKAGQKRWLGRRPVVRGVAMNPIDHPHGGGEGRTKGGRPSVSPWGKPTKGGFKTVIRKHNTKQ